MKMKQKYLITWCLALPLAVAVSFNTTAQDGKPLLSEHQQMLDSTDNATTGNFETLSGIYLRRAAKGTYQLDFSQKLKEDAVLRITGKAGKLVYQKPVSKSKNKTSWRYNVGKLKPDTYLVEVKTSDTTYWTKFRVGR